jgi:hypothetical protein
MEDGVFGRLGQQKQRSFDGLYALKTKDVIVKVKGKWIPASKTKPTFTLGTIRYNNHNQTKLSNI